MVGEAGAIKPEGKSWLSNDPAMALSLAKKACKDKNIFIAIDGSKKKISELTLADFIKWAEGNINNSYSLLWFTANQMDKAGLSEVDADKVKGFVKPDEYNYIRYPETKKALEEYKESLKPKQEPKPQGSLPAPDDAPPPPVTNIAPTIKAVSATVEGEYLAFEVEHIPEGATTAKIKFADEKVVDGTVADGKVLITLTNDMRSKTYVGIEIAFFKPVDTSSDEELPPRLQNGTLIIPR